MNNIFTVVLSVLVGVLAGVSLLLGINNTVINANVPIFIQVKEIAAKQVELQKQVVETSEGVAKQQQLLENLILKADKIVMAAAQAQAQQPRQPQPQAPQQPPEEDFDRVYNIPVSNTPIIGKKDAPVTITMFTDLECPFCHRFYPGVQETLKNYPDKVRLLIKNFPLPFHPKARPAAKLALAASEQGKYKEMVEALMANGADHSENKVKEYAKDMGLNFNRLMSDLKNNDAKYEAQIKEDEQLVQSSEVRGTPTFFVNGKKVMARDAAGYKEIIDKL